MGRLPLPESAPHDGADKASREQEEVPTRKDETPFRSLLGRLLTVPHKEIIEQEQRWRANRKRSPR